MNLVFSKLMNLNLKIKNKINGSNPSYKLDHQLSVEPSRDTLMPKI